MGKVTSKYQVSIPKALADRLDIKPGDEVDWEIAGRELRVTPHGERQMLPLKVRLEMLEASRQRQIARDRGKPRVKSASRGWTREDANDRGRTR